MSVIENAIEDAFAYFHSDGADVSETERVRRYDAAQKIIADQPEVAAALLATEFDTINFQRKSAAYRLIIGLGSVALETLKSRLEHAGEVGRIWLVSILHYHGDNSRSEMMVELVRSKDQYAAQLATQALVFQGRQGMLDVDELMLTLAGTLLSEHKIEGSAFFLADSALSCLRLLTGESFLDAKKWAVHFYNFDHFLFTPPVHPFPYTSDRVNTLSLRERKQLVDKVMIWWERNRKTVKLKSLVSCFEL